jgi:hypothetical protein
MLCGIVEWDNNHASRNETVREGSGRGLLYVLFSTFHIVTEKRCNYGRLWVEFRLWMLVNTTDLMLKQKQVHSVAREITDYKS